MVRDDLYSRWFRSHLAGQALPCICNGRTRYLCRIREIDSFLLEGIVYSTFYGGNYTMFKVIYSSVYMDYDIVKDNHSRYWVNYPKNTYGPFDTYAEACLIAQKEYQNN